MKIKLLIAVLILINFSCRAQKIEVWENFVSSKKNSVEPILPDFSYAGYKYSEQAIPIVNYKVFNVQDFGAIPNDGKSDKIAFEKAIKAATDNKEGIILFPKGKYHFFTDDDDLAPIVIKASNIVIRGEGQGEDGTILFFERNLEAKDPNKLWTTPKMLVVTAPGKNKVILLEIQNEKLFQLKWKMRLILKRMIGLF